MDIDYSHVRVENKSLDQLTCLIDGIFGLLWDMGIIMRFYALRMGLRVLNMVMGQQCSRNKS